MTMKQGTWMPRDISFNRNDGLPKYIAIARAIASAITERELAAGELLPSQKELADSFGVTVMTLRQAIQTLVERGLLVSEHGKGTYVRSQPYRLPLGTLSSFAAQIAASGHTLRTEVLAFTRIEITPLEQRRMSLAVAEAFELVRLRYVDGEPLVLQSSLLPCGIGERIDPGALDTTSLYELLSLTLGVRIDHASETVQATSLDADSAAILRRQAGEPALLSARLTFTAEGLAVVDDRALAAGDSLVISAVRRADETGMSLVLPQDAPPLIADSPRFLRGEI